MPCFPSLQTPFKDLNIIPLQSIAYPYPLSTVFPSAASPVGRSQNASSAASTNGTATAAAAAVATDAKDMVVALDRTDVEAGSVGWEDTMGFLKVVDYRYTRFVLDERVPGKAQWRMVRCVRALTRIQRRSRLTLLTLYPSCAQ